VQTHQQLAELTDQKFEIAVRRLADDLRFGYDASPYLGAGVEYVQSRPFVEGDSTRDIDWRVSARMSRYYVKQYEAPKTTPLYLLVDTSASMAFSSQVVSKYDLAVLIAGGLGLAALRRLSPIGVLGTGQRDVHFEPSLSRPQVFQWLHALRWRRFDERTQLAARVDELSGWLSSRCLVLVLSDLHDPGALAAIKRLAQRHDCAVLHLQDPAERGRLRGGLFLGQEAETGRAFVAHGNARWFGLDQPPEESLRQAGIDYLPLATDQLFVAPLRRFLAERGGWLRNAR
jgi:uncharacterized protein (DUF58 family)